MVINNIMAFFEKYDRADINKEASKILYNAFRESYNYKPILDNQSRNFLGGGFLTGFRYSPNISIYIPEPYDLLEGTEGYLHPYIILSERPMDLRVLVFPSTDMLVRVISELCNTMLKYDEYMGNALVSRQFKMIRLKLESGRVYIARDLPDFILSAESMIAKVLFDGAEKNYSSNVHYIHSNQDIILADRYGVGLRGNRSNFGKSKVVQENEEKLLKEVEKNLESRSK
jgi:hypothetical protein